MPSEKKKPSAHPSEPVQCHPAMADDNDPALLPEGKTWLEAAKRGDVHAMKPLLAAQPAY